MEHWAKMGQINKYHKLGDFHSTRNEFLNPLPRLPYAYRKSLLM